MNSGFLIHLSNTFLVIVGGGEEENQYRQYIADHNLENVQLVGFKQKEEIFEYYKAADLFVLPTREDIWGLVINEAMACICWQSYMRCQRIKSIFNLLILEKYFFGCQGL